MLDDTLSLQILLLTQVLSNTSLSLRFVIWETADCGRENVPAGKTQPFTMQWGSR